MSLILFAFSMAESFGYPLITPMILARMDSDEVTLGVMHWPACLVVC